MKNILKYIILYISIIIFLFILLVLVAKISTKYVENNINESVSFYEKNNGIERTNPKIKGTYLHYYADSTILNIIYNLDTNDPIKSIMWDNYYKERRGDINDGFIDTVKYNKKANINYLRYWHGSIIILKLLLLMFNIEQIYLLNKVLLFLLGIILFFKLFKNDKFLSITYMIGMIMICFYYVPFCFEYSWTFYIMFISSIISINLKDDKKFYILMFINGLLTCFFDFLSTEILTLLLPLILYLKINNKSLKEGIKIIIKSSLLWISSYTFTYIVKWLLASLILDINVLPYVKDNVLLRFNVVNYHNYYRAAILNNIFNLFPFCFIHNIYLFRIILMSILLICILCFNIKINRKSFLFLIIGLIPYIRYLILSNHSYFHSFFTFRDQLVTIMCFLIFIKENINFKNSLLGGLYERINNFNALFR